MNKFKKYCPNVWVAECETEYNKGEIIELTTKYGKCVECEVYNLVSTVNNKFYYSIVRVEDISYEERKAEKYNNSAKRHDRKSDEWYQKSKEGEDFLSLAEPIKIGHHSERRHRALTDRNRDRLGNSVKESEIAAKMKAKAARWEDPAQEINLSRSRSFRFL